MNNITIPCRLDALATLPAYAHDGDAGMDLCAAIEHPIILYPGQRKIIPIGMQTAIPKGSEMQIRSLLGLALKGILVANSPGTIDSPFRGGIGVILMNLGDEPFIIESGMRIAQGVFTPVCHATFEIVDQLPDSPRGTDGFGSTG